MRMDNTFLIAGGTGGEQDQCVVVQTDVRCGSFVIVDLSCFEHADAGIVKSAG